ncbi:hypothetical protein TNCV_1298151 [Trichonephila clavipes]|nr:hypothetical protein TNCV_1298151 [Trichonephila clavipes]
MWYPACHKIESCTTESPPCRKSPMHVKYVEAQMSSRWWGVEILRGSVSSDVVLVTWIKFKITRSVTNCPMVV